MKDRTLRDRKGVEIREGCTIRTKALTLDRNGVRHYECFKVTRIRGRLCVQKRIGEKNLRTFSVAYIQRWLRDESMEVTEEAPE